MSGVTLSKEVWSHLYDFLRDCDRIHTNNESRVKRFVEAVLWMSRSGSQWRLLPREYGDWNTVYKRFNDWTAKDIWTQMFAHFSQANDLEYLIIDATIMRAHACASGAKKGAMKRLDAAKAA